MRVRLGPGGGAVSGADVALRVLALLMGSFAAMCAVAFFLAGLLPGPSAPWWKQYGLAAVAFTVAYVLLPYGLRFW